MTIFNKEKYREDRIITLERDFLLAKQYGVNYKIFDQDKLNKFIEKDRMKSLHHFIFVCIFIVIIICLISFVNAAPIMESTSVIAATVSGSGVTTTTTAESGTNSVSGSGFTCNKLIWIETDYCKTNFCPRYLKVNNCSKYPASSHLCCTMYYKEDVTLIVSNTTETPIIINITVTNNQTKEKQQLGAKDFIAPILLCVTLIYVGILVSTKSRNKN